MFASQLFTFSVYRYVLLFTDYVIIFVLSLMTADYVFVVKWSQPEFKGLGRKVRAAHSERKGPLLYRIVKNGFIYLL